MLALVIRDTGEYERLDLGEFSELQKACGGTVVRGGEHEGATCWYEHVDGEIVESPSIMADAFEHLTMWCNEEAFGMNANPKATILVGWWGAEYPDGSLAMLKGDVVITGPTTSDGNRSPLSEEDAAKLEAELANIVLIPR